MKKAIFLFMTLLMCCAFLSCSKDDDPALMTIAVTAVTITEGETYAMTVGDTHFSCYSIPYQCYRQEYYLDDCF